jgi:hypothetical protein
LTEPPPATIPVPIDVKSTVTDSTSDNDNSEKVDESFDSTDGPADVNDNLKKSVSAISSASNDDNVVYPHGWRLAIIVLSLCFSVFLVALDQTIIATAM